ncbi:MAG: phage tail sheath family protein, partial [Actinomycetota bacterium]
MPTYLSPGVYVEEMEAGSRPIEGVGTAVAAFVGLAAMGPVNEPTLVTNWSAFTQTFGEFVEGYYLAHAVYGYFMNGGGACYIVRVGGNSNGSSPTGQAALPSGSSGSLGSYKVNAITTGPEGNAISVEVTPPSEGSSDDQFRLVVRQDGQQVEEFDKVTTKRGKQNVATLVNAQSKLIRIEETGPAGSLEKPAVGTVALTGGAAAPTPVQLTPEDYIGDAAQRTGFGGLEAIDPVTIVSVPDLMTAYQRGMIDMEGLQAVQLAVISHCENMGDRMAILDPPPGLNAQQIREWRVDKVAYDSKFATLYWPWIKVFD